MPVPIFASRTQCFFYAGTFVEKAEHSLEKARVIQ